MSDGVIFPHKQPPRLETRALHCIAKLAVYYAIALEEEEDLERCEVLVELIHKGIPPLLANNITELLIERLVPLLEGNHSIAVRQRLLETAVHPSTTDLNIYPWNWNHLVIKHLLTSVLGSLTKLQKLKLRIDCINDVDISIQFPETLQEVNFVYSYSDGMLVALAKFCPHLKCLKLGEFPSITNVGVEAIIQLQQLEELDVTSVPQVIEFAFLLSSKLKVFRCGSTRASRLNALAKSGEFPHLHQVSVKRLICDVPLEDGLRALSALHIETTRFSSLLLLHVGYRLQELSLDNTKDIDLWTLSEHCSVLQNLSMMFCTQHSSGIHDIKNMPSFLSLKQVTLDSNRNLCEWCILRQSTALEKITIVIFQGPPERNNVCLDKLLLNNPLLSLQEFGAHARHTVDSWQLSSLLSTAVAWQLLKQCPRLAMLRGIQYCDSMKKDVQKDHPDIKLFE